MHIDEEPTAPHDGLDDSLEERSARALEALLDDLASGSLGNFSIFFSTISNSLLYAPITEQDENASQSKVSVVNFNQEGRRVVPVFTRKGLLDEWFKTAEQQFFSIAGGDLAMTLPKDSWLLLNPGTETSVELSPEQVAVLASTEHADIHGFQTATKEVPNTSSSDFIFPNDQEEEVFEQEAGAGEEAEPENAPEFLQLQSQLDQILSDFVEVREGYIRVPEDGPAHAVLGLLNTPIGAERRFILIEKIAELARDTFGADGAIEVYDDLSFDSSSSWTLFNAITPFYHVESSMTDNLESSQASSAFDADPISWDDVKKRGSKLLDSIVGRKVSD